MSAIDFDLSTLARYLHIAPAEVEKMASRGRIPGRKVQGAWRFSKSEIHHWLEERISASDAAELEQLEQALEKAKEVDDEELSLATLLPEASVEVPLPARTRSSVIRSMVDLASRTGWLWSPDEMVEAIESRETMCSTALDNGIALLHPRRPLESALAQPLIALGITSQGIPFGNVRGGLTDVFFLIASVSDRGHLRALARLSRVISDAELVPQLRRTENTTEARNLILSMELSIFD